MNTIPRTLVMASATLLSCNSIADSQLETLTVTASRIEMPLREVGASLSVMSADEIEARGQTTVGELLRTMPSVNASNNGGLGKATTIRIRGEEGYKTKVLIDGIDISDPTGTQVQPQIQHIMSANIERIEVLRGPQGMMYGADSGGVINIISKKADKPLQGGLSAEYGRYNSRQLAGNVRGKMDRFDYSLLVSDLSTDGFNAHTDDATPADDDGYENTTVGASGGFDITESLRVQATMRDVEGDNEFDQCYNSDTFSTTDVCEGEFEQTNYKVDLMYNRGSMENKLSYARTDTARQNHADNAVKTLDTDGELDQLQYLGTLTLSDSAKLLFGMDLEEESLDSSSSGADSERDQKGVYAEWQGSHANRFFYTAGVRHDDNDDFGEHTSYRATTAYILPVSQRDNVKFRASYGTGFRAPSLYEIAYNQSPSAMAPASLIQLSEEQSEGFDIGVEYHRDNGLYASLTYFDQEVEDEIYFDLSDFSGYLQETGTSESTGVELAFEAPVTQSLKFHGNYTYNDTETADGQQRVRRPRNVANIGVTLAALDQRLKMRLDSRIVKDAVDEQSGIGYVDLDDYETVNANLSYAVSSDMEIYVRGENILDEDYQEVTGYNTAGAAVYGGIRLHF